MKSGAAKTGPAGPVPPPLQNISFIMYNTRNGVINGKSPLTIHFRPKCSTCSSDFFMMNGLSLPLVSQYKYLGIILEEHLTFLPAAKNRLDLASKAFWSIQSSISNVPGDAFKKLFESLVASVLDYGAPLWAPRNTVERLQQHAYRCFLGVGRKHAAAASAGDMCWMPTFRRHQHQYIMMWISIMKMGNNRICKRVYKQ